MEVTTWVIWSYQHDSWWKPGSHGYTRDFRRAGLYTEGEAKKIEKQANLYCKTHQPNEVAMHLLDALHFPVPGEDRPAGPGIVGSLLYDMMRHEE